MIKEIIKSAYEMYMPQVESEITQLAEFLYGKQILSFIEIGTKFGGTFKVFNEIVDLNSNHLFRCEGTNNTGMRISIDLPDGIHGGINRDLCLDRNEYFLKSYENVHMITGDSHTEQVETQLKLLLNGTQVDFLFIDGDHTFEGVKQDFEMYEKYVKPGGWIAFHDINDTDRHRNRNVFVGKFWNLIKNTYFYVEFNALQDWAGIGVIQKSF